MASEQQKPSMRLVFQGSIPFEDADHAEMWYRMLKEMVMVQAPGSTLNGQIMKMLEPCCGKTTDGKLHAGVSYIGPTVVHRT
jgi:hypothetical protein